MTEREKGGGVGSKTDIRELGARDPYTRKKGNTGERSFLTEKRATEKANK